MADIQKTISIIFQGENKVGDALKGVESGLDGIESNAKGATGSIEQLDTELEDLGGKSRGIADVGDALRALAGALVVQRFIEANTQAEKFELAMTSLKGSTEAAAIEFEYISNVSRTLGLNLFDAADAYVQLTAATKGTALEGQATRDIFEAVSTAMGKLGRSSADTEGALLAISQIVSKGNVSLEELRGQLGERLPGAFGIAADAMGLTTKELDALVSSGNLTASEFLPKFAAALRNTFGDTTYIEGYTASWNRLQNSLNEAFVVIGKAGVFDAITKGVQVATASITGAVAGFTLLGEIIGNVAGAIATGDFSGLGDAIDEAMARAADKTRAASDAMLGATQAAVDLKYEGEQAGKKIEDGMTNAAGSTEDLAKASKEVDAALKAIGLDPKQFQDPIAEVVKAFESLAKNPAVTGEQFLSGLLLTLDKIKDADSLNAVFDATAQAFKDGRLNAEQYAAALGALESKQDGTWEAMQRTTAATGEQAKSLEKSAKEAAKAEEAAAKLALELEKLASNERIALIEANVQLNVAQIEADTQKAIAAFESLSESVNSTGETLSSLYGTLAGGDLDFRQQLGLERELQKESQRRDEALKLQRELTEVQIDEVRARTEAMQRGDALVKIEGDGLQPHLEAFMWEILRAIQVRVNADGGAFLLGVNP